MEDKNWKMNTLENKYTKEDIKILADMLFELKQADNDNDYFFKLYKSLVTSDYELKSAFKHVLTQHHWLYDSLEYRDYDVWDEDIKHIMLYVKYEDVPLHINDGVYLTIFVKWRLKIRK